MDCTLWAAAKRSAEALAAFAMPSLASAAAAFASPARSYSWSSSDARFFARSTAEPAATLAAVAPARADAVEVRARSDARSRIEYSWSSSAALLEAAE